MVRLITVFHAVFYGAEEYGVFVMNVFPVLGGYGRGMFSMLRKVEEREVQGLAFPVTLGRDFSGVITQTGKGVTRLKAGDEVGQIILLLQRKPCCCTYFRPFLVDAMRIQ